MKAITAHITDSDGQIWVRHWVGNLIFCPPHLFDDDYECPVCQEMEKS
jgi:hypothetical protein